MATVAVVSGRALADVRALVGLDDIVYAGNHGFEIRGPGGTALSYEVGREFLDDVARVRDVLAQRVGLIPGAWVEDKAHSLSVHYRQTPQEHLADVEAAVDGALADAPRLRKHHGKKVFEIRPDRLAQGARGSVAAAALGLEGEGVFRSIWATT